MGPGITLVILGSILAFAVRAEARYLDLNIVGFILIIAGIVVIWDSHRNARRERTVTRVEESTDPELPTHTVQERIQEDRRR